MPPAVTSISSSKWATPLKPIVNQPHFLESPRLRPWKSFASNMPKSIPSALASTTGQICDRPPQSMPPGMITNSPTTLRAALLRQTLPKKLIFSAMPPLDLLTIPPPLMMPYRHFKNTNPSAMSFTARPATIAPPTNKSSTVTIPLALMRLPMSWMFGLFGTPHFPLFQKLHLQKRLMPILP